MLKKISLFLTALLFAASLLAQAPTGNGGVRVYEDLMLENKTVKNIRYGI